jgi:class 3 adenylate cyclase
VPLYMDRHEPPGDGQGLTREEAFAAHQLDLDVEGKHGVRFLGGLVDLERQMAFCVCEAPSAEAVEAVHREAHGSVGSKVIEIDFNALTAFLGLQKSMNELGELGLGFTNTLRTILFTDIESSTALNRRLGDEEALVVRREHDRIVREGLERSGGQQVKSLGDGILACFSSVTKALECAIDIQRGVAAYADEAEHPIRVRIGMAAGEPVADGDDLFGLAVNLASRVCDVCEPGCIFVTSSVRDLAAGKGFEWDDAGEHSFKGFDEPVRVYRVRWSA